MIIITALALIIVVLLGLPFIWRRTVISIQESKERYRAEQAIVDEYLSEKEAKRAAKKARKQAKKQKSNDLPSEMTGSDYDMVRSLEYGSEYNKYAKSLKINTEVMEATFEKHNLQILQFAFQPISDEDADCTCIVELSAIHGNRIEHDVAVKVNLYDKDGEIILSEEEYLYSEDFDGYDTVTVYLYDGGQAIFEAKSARIYAAKY